MAHSGCLINAIYLLLPPGSPPVCPGPSSGSHSCLGAPPSTKSHTLGSNQLVPWELERVIGSSWGPLSPLHPVKGWAQNRCAIYWRRGLSAGFPNCSQQRAQGGVRASREQKTSCTGGQAPPQQWPLSHLFPASRAPSPRGCTEHLGSAYCELCPGLGTHRGSSCDGGP